ncbi:phosphate ABC transporter permease subunit PstC [bacterium]|nr:phosphate ABC transporter permease subunit PstC [bacterium]
MKLWRKHLERVIQWGLLISATVTIIAVLLIFVFLGKEGLPALLKVPLSNLLGDRWIPVSFENPRYGVLPLIAGSILVTFLATVIAVPFGVGGATYLSEFAGRAEREILKPFIEVLAGIPSVVLGFFGLVVIGPALKSLFGLTSSLTALTGAILLAFMALPTILSIAEDALRAVPRSFKEASLALGATSWQTTWKVTLPAASPGVIAAVLLGIGRVIGETMAVMMVTGNAAVLTASPFDSVRTITATIAAEMGEVPFGSDHYRILFLIGLLLLGMTLAVNLYARRLLVGKIRRRKR